MAKDIKNESVQHTVKPKQKDVKENKMAFVFNRKKYLIMLGGLGLILIGFVLMMGGGSDDPNTFSYELFSFRRLTLAPILVVAGFVVEIFAIMIKPRNDATADGTKPE